MGGRRRGVEERGGEEGRMGRDGGDAAGGRDGADIHAALLELDRLEELIEELDDLGIANRTEAEARLAELGRRLDQSSRE